jgi:hypothetical protein
MSFARVIIIASICLGLTAAAAQQRTNQQGGPQPPLFQGVMFDAKGKTVGRVFPNDQYVWVVRQISGVWVKVPVDDVECAAAEPRAFSNATPSSTAEFGASCI